MNNRHESTQDRQGRERPRDDHGRFESEHDQSRHTGREGRRFDTRLDTDDRYGSREESMRPNYDRYESGRRQNSFDWPQGNDRFDREPMRSRGGSNEWNEPSSWSRSNYGGSEDSRYENRGSQMNRGYGGYRSESDRPYRLQESAYSEYDQGRWPTGGSNRTESMFGIGGFNRDMSHSSYDMGAVHEQGSYAGKGPKGYRRSDERIEEDVNEALSQNPEIDATDIEVKVNNGEVTLSGTVSERQFKRIAEDVAERCSGVQDVRNEIRVQRESDSGTSSHNQSQTKGKSNGGTGMKVPESKTA
jgi:hypothetical protein